MKEIDEDRDRDGKSWTVEKDVKNSPGRRLRDTAADLCLHVRRWHKVHTHELPVCWGTVPWEWHERSFTSYVSGADWMTAMCLAIFRSRLCPAVALRSHWLLQRAVASHGRVTRTQRLCV